MPRMQRYGQPARYNPILHQDIPWGPGRDDADDSFLSSRNHDRERTHFEGVLHGPGWQPITLDQWTKTFRVLEIFRLGINRMPEQGCTFRSKPRLFPRGDFKVSTGKKALIDKPSVVLKLRLRQKIFNFEFIKASDWRTIERYSLLNSHNVPVIGTRTGVLGNPGQYWWFPEITFDLNRNQTLLITLEAEVKMELEGTGVIRFEDSWLKMFEWDIQEVV